MGVDEITHDFSELRDRLKEEIKDGNFLLVDLAGSTIFKTKHHEIDWVTRLRTFYEIVINAVSPLPVCKFLGDAIFVATTNDQHSSEDFVQAAEKTIEAVDQYNHSAPTDHIIQVRVILNSGPAYFFDGDDPQGSAVDKLFRMEKFVPDGCIGMTEEFAARAGKEQKPVAWFPLKGLPKTNGHGLIFLGTHPDDEILSSLVSQSQAAALWGLARENKGLVYLVGGYIPGEFDNVQVGDMNAKIGALQLLATIGEPADDFLVSADYPDDAYNKNIITIGGPCHNNVTLKLMEGLPVEFLNIDDPDDDDTPLLDKQTGNEFKAKRGPHGLERDCGLFVRCRNPLNPARKIIIASGIESPAVDGIVRAFSPTANPQFRQLLEEVLKLGSGEDDDPMPEFLCIMEFTVEKNGRAVLPKFNDQIKFISRI